MPTATPTRTRPPIGTVSNTFADGFGIWHAEIEAREGNRAMERFGAPLRALYNRAAKAIHTEIAIRQGTPPPFPKVRYLGTQTRPDGSMYALFKERTD